MADKTIIINAQVDTGNSVQDLENLEQGIEGVTEATKDLSGVEKSFDDLNKRIEKGELAKSKDL